MITAVDLLRGLAQLIGWRRIDVPGATGYLDTDYAAKGRYAVAALKDVDLVCVHVEATDEASHQGDAAAKIEALEEIDRHIVGPLLGGTAGWRRLSHPRHSRPSDAAADQDAQSWRRAVCDGRQRHPARRRRALRRSDRRPAPGCFPEGWKLMGQFLGELVRGCGKKKQEQPAYSKTITPRAEQAGLALIAALRQFLPGQSWSAVRRLVEHRHVRDQRQSLRRRRPAAQGRRRGQGLAGAPQRPAARRGRQDPPPRRPSGGGGEAGRRDHAPAQRGAVLAAAPAAASAHARRDRPPHPGPEGSAETAGPGGTSRPTAAGVRAVHRLDRDTSGLMVFALSAEAERRLVQMFRKHIVERVYQAIVPGRVEAQTFASRLVRDRGDGRRGSTTLPDVGKRAVTHVRPLEYPRRLHAAGVPAGDRPHAPDSHSPGRGGPSRLRREGLQPAALPPAPARPPAARRGRPCTPPNWRFDHPITGEPLRFTMPLPADMARLLVRLRAGKPK